MKPSPPRPFDPFPALLHRALEFAASAHEGQLRKQSRIPYFSHPAMVGLLLQRGGWDDETVAAGILHDVVEDTPTTLAEIEAHFGSKVALLVGYASETKKDAEQKDLPWQVRKETKLAKLKDAPPEALAIILADMLHNLYSTLADVRAGKNVWSRFKAPKGPWLEMARRGIEQCAGVDERLEPLVVACRGVVQELARLE